MIPTLFGVLSLANPPIPAWDPAAKGDHITLSDANHTATDSDNGSFEIVRALTVKSSGKWAFSARVTKVGNPGVGIATADAALNNFLGADVYGYGYLSNGRVFNAGGAIVTTYATLATGDVVSVAVDFDAGKAWWAKNGSWNGNPSAGTDGVPIAAGNYFQAGNTLDSGDAVALVSPTSLPTGFHSWV